MVSKESCRFCNADLIGGSVRRLVIDQPDRFELSLGLISKPGLRTWAQCGSCSNATQLYSYDDHLLAEIETNYYEIDFKGSTLLEKYSRVLNLQPSESDNHFRVRRILNYLRLFGKNPEKLSYLDVGSGLGVFPKALQANGCLDLSIIEPDVTARAHLECIFESGIYESLDAVSRTYDVITVNKVLEHVRSPSEFLKQLMSKVNDTGVLYIEVPSVNSMQKCSPSDNALGALHRYLFSIEGLNLLATNCDFEMVFGEQIFEPSGKYSVYGFFIKC